MGEGSDSVRKSSLQLFENGLELGPASAAHQYVRDYGRGAFSHWGNTLYFSSSDNSNPLKSGRDYAGLACVSIDEEESRAHAQASAKANSPRNLGATLAASANTQGAELHSIVSLRMLLIRCRSSGIDLIDRSCLEIGSSPSCGLAIALGLLGVKHLFINNVVRVMSDQIDFQFARNIAALTNLITPTSRTLDDVVLLNSDGRRCRLNPLLFTNVSGMDAARLVDNVEPADFIFSFSVLEHIRHLYDVMRALRQCGSPTCQSIHFVDLRDHTDFARPLKFLYLDADEFARNYSHDHNRTRYSGYLEVFVAAGWEICSVVFIDQLPLLEQGSTDLYQMLLLGPEKFFRNEQKLLTRAISTDEISRLAPEFRKLSQDELSVLVFSVTLLAIAE